MPEQDYDKDFPNLKGIGYSRTSEPADYNCISYAVGDLDRWWWPSDRDDEYWPFPVPDPSKVNLETFIAGFAHVRFERCDSGNPEPGFEKIALYALADGTVKHAARP